uniref:Homeobox domain-containing protein n=1 Tax=Plectus sambesii TaxID=2011161 RepID=A0A914VGT9_9BILA
MNAVGEHQLRCVEDEAAAKRRFRTNFSDAQSAVLEERFQQTHYPDQTAKRQLARSLDIAEDRITKRKINKADAVYQQWVFASLPPLSASHVPDSSQSSALPKPQPPTQTTTSSNGDFVTTGEQQRTVDGAAFYDSANSWTCFY